MTRRSPAPRGSPAPVSRCEPGTRAVAIERADRVVVTELGESIAYDTLVLATGSVNRVLPMFPPSNGIHYLRTEAEALALKAQLDRSKSLVLIGGGVVGLEIAASATEIGVKTTVIEIAPRILARVCDTETAALIHERHRARGVDIRVATSVAALNVLPDGGFTVDHRGGRRHRGRCHCGGRRRDDGRSSGAGGGP